MSAFEQPTSGDRSPDEQIDARAHPPMQAAGAIGAQRFAAARDALAELADRPLSEHADVFASVHAQLQDALAEIDGV